MRHYLKQLVICTIAFYVAYSLVPTITIGKDPANIAIIIGGLLITALIIRPIFALVLLPINFLTFGLISLILNVAFIFALLNFLPGFKIASYAFKGTDIRGFIVPPYSFSQLGAIVLIAVIITLTQKILHIIFE